MASRSTITCKLCSAVCKTRDVLKTLYKLAVFASAGRYMAVAVAFHETQSRERAKPLFGLTKGINISLKLFCYAVLAIPHYLIEQVVSS